MPEQEWEKLAREWDKRVDAEAAAQLEENKEQPLWDSRYRRVQEVSEWLRQCEQAYQQQLAELLSYRDDITHASAALKRHASILYDIPISDIHLGGWDCKYSATGHCVYDTRNDRALDDCVVCHQPSERK